MSYKILSTSKKRMISLEVLTTGFALFSMFFGAGNLVFPLVIGKIAGLGWPYAILGLTLTAVVVPFLGLAAMLFFGAECQKFLGRIGRFPGILLFFLLQVILGPFGVIPRLFTLMHAILKPYLFDISIGVFSLMISSFIFIFAFRQQNIIRLIGVFLTPILIGCLLLLVLSGIWHPPIEVATESGAWTCFKSGLLGGYNTMDLIAAFLFATVVLPHFKGEMSTDPSPEQKKKFSKKIFYSSLIAALLLFFTYVGICFISARHAASLDPFLPAEEILNSIAYKLLGGAGGAIASITIVMACLTTAISLTSIFANYFRKEISKNTLSSSFSLMFTLIIASCLANLGFTGISKFLNPILEICYPGLIVMTLLNIFYYFTGFRVVKFPVFFTFALSLFIYLVKQR